MNMYHTIIMVVLYSNLFFCQNFLLYVTCNCTYKIIPVVALVLAWISDHTKGAISLVWIGNCYIHTVLAVIWGIQAFAALRPQSLECQA